jgi:hypothetical protein
MTRKELDAAVDMARNLFRTNMAQKGYAQYIEMVENQINIPDMIQYVLQAAEDVRRADAKATETKK